MIRGNEKAAEGDGGRDEVRAVRAAFMLIVHEKTTGVKLIRPLAVILARDLDLAQRRGWTAIRDGLRDLAAREVGGEVGR
jgi:hypothetical protein